MILHVRLNFILYFEYICSFNIFAGSAIRGYMPLSQIPTGQIPAGQIPTGQLPAGQIPAGQMPSGNVSSMKLSVC